MSTVQEIQEAIGQLREEERLTLLQWIHLHEEAYTLAEEGARQLDAGQGIPLDQARRMISQWTTK